MSEYALKVENVSKSFRLPHEKHNSLKQTALNWYKKREETLHVLKNLDLEIKKGEFFGVIGRNGSGKSTLLKLIAGIYQPTKGRIQINGRLTSFIELGVGFNPELTGRDNIFLNGIILGLTRRQVQEKYEEIVDFAELERFMDQKLKNYSSGMLVRLAFSIAMQAHSDILLIDEVLAVGDASFQKKCFEHFHKLKKDGKTVIFVTHDMANVLRFCDRVLVLDKGKTLGVKKPSSAKFLYESLNEPKAKKTLNTAAKRWGSGKVRVKNVTFLNKDFKKVKKIKLGSGLIIKIDLESELKDNVPIKVGLAFYDKEDTNISGQSSSALDIVSSCKSVFYKLDKIPFNSDKIYLTVSIVGDEGLHDYDHIHKGYAFNVDIPPKTYGKVSLPGVWSTSEKNLNR